MTALTPSIRRPARDRVLTALLVLCLLGVTGSVAALALWADKLIVVREELR